MTRTLSLVVALCLLLAAVLALAVPTHAAPPAQNAGDWEIPGGRFFTQAAPQGYGFSVVDDGQARFWTEFNRLGGLQNVGYPISQRFQYDGFVTQAFQKLVLQWRPEVNQAWPVNVFDELSRHGHDDKLYATRQTPYPLQNFDPPGATWVQIVANRQALLNANPAIRARYFSVPDPMTVFGLPVSRVEDMGNHYAIRTQRAVFQQWKETVPWAAAGQVTIANGGDIAKELGWMQPTWIEPEPIGGSADEWYTKRLIAGHNQPETLIALQEQSDVVTRWRLLISTTGGTTWRMGIPLPPCLTDIAVDQQTMSHYYAATCRGVQRWNGSQWEVVLPGYPSIVAVRPNKGDEAWAAQRDPSNPRNFQTLRTTNGGAQWQTVSSEAAYLPGRFELDGITSWAFGLFGGGNTSHLRRSQGGAWEEVPPPYTKWADKGMTVDSNTERLYLAASEYVNGWDQRPTVLWRTAIPNSADLSDVEWISVYTFEATSVVEALAATRDDGQAVLFVAQRSLVSDANVAALYRSLDGGATWIRFSTIAP